MSKDEAQENERSRESADDHVNFHANSLSCSARNFLSLPCIEPERRKKLQTKPVLLPPSFPVIRGRRPLHPMIRHFRNFSFRFGLHVLPCLAIKEFTFAIAVPTSATKPSTPVPSESTSGNRPGFGTIFRALFPTDRFGRGSRHGGKIRRAAHLQSRQWLNAALGFFFPVVCQICELERATPVEGFVCARCWGSVRFIKPPFCERCGLPFQGEITSTFECSNCREMKLHFRSARSAVTTGGPVLEAIHRYKYQRALWFEVFLADLLIRQAQPELRGEKWDWIVPVPLHPVKEREREFNQAERIAARLAAATRIPMNTRLLKRVQPTQTQTRLTRQQRAANVRNAFVMRDTARLNGERIVVLDDVFTTGATTSACARALRKAGAGEVCVWTVARGT
jgi:competence protein ComFC